MRRWVKMIRIIVNVYDGGEDVIRFTKKNQFPFKPDMPDIVCWMHSLVNTRSSLVILWEHELDVTFKMKTWIFEDNPLFRTHTHTYRFSFW